MSNHLKLAHAYWKEILSPGDVAIDATCGNGHDTAFLSKLGVKIIAYDVQKEAIEASQKKVPDALFRLQSHACFKESEADLIVYNLGYLPGGNKQLTTHYETTLRSVKNALTIVKKAISITCYPGHSEGAREEAVLLEYIQNLNPQQWQVCYHRWINRQKSPSLIWLSLLPS